MKNLLIVVGVILVTSTNTFAQQFGIKTGVNFNRVNGPESLESGDNYEFSSNFTTTVGFNAGLTFEYELNDNFGLTTGLIFTQRGTGVSMVNSYSETNSEYEYSASYTEAIRYKVNSNFIDIPLLFKAGFDVGNTKLYGLLGGTFGMAIFGKMKMEYEYNYEEIFDGETYSESGFEIDSEIIDYGFDGSEMLNRIHIGMVPGIGAEFGNIQLEATYNMGLNNMLGDTGEIWKANTLNVSVGYKFGQK